MPGLISRPSEYRADRVAVEQLAERSEFAGLRAPPSRRREWIDHGPREPHSSVRARSNRCARGDTPVRHEAVRPGVTGDARERRFSRRRTIQPEDPTIDPTRLKDDKQVMPNVSDATVHANDAEKTPITERTQAVPRRDVVFFVGVCSAGYHHSDTCIPDPPRAESPVGVRTSNQNGSSSRRPARRSAASIRSRIRRFSGLFI